ncbi:MAG: peptide deformylase [Bacteroidia bacterium]|nr:peptide deformylase [Bacteroidia bacterium]
MVLPIVAYGDTVLNKTGLEIDKNYPELKELIANMFETMYEANGVGLAAPQVGKSIRLFIIDASPFAEDKDEEGNPLEEYKGLKNFKKVFINAKIIAEEGEEWSFNEGCLSIPKIREDVLRLPKINISYYDENFIHHEEIFEGIAARIIQHEYDHIEGKLFVDRINPMRRKMLKGKLEDITKGRVEVLYKMRFPKKR